MSHLSVTLPDGDTDANPRRLGYHQDHESAIADGTLTPFVDFDFGALEAVSELAQSDAERLAEALGTILAWLADKRWISNGSQDPEQQAANMARSLKSAGLRALALTLMVRPALVGDRQLREAARMAGCDEARLRRLVRQLESRFGLSNPFRR
jgi:hypothetical protein